MVFEARVFLSTGQCSHANEGQRWKATDGGDVVGIAIFLMPKHASRSWWNSKFLLREVFSHQAQVHQVSLKGIWRWPATHHRSMLRPPIDEPSIPLDSWCGILAKGASPSYPLLDSLHLRWFLKLGFLITRGIIQLLDPSGLRTNYLMYFYILDGVFHLWGGIWSKNILFKEFSTF